MSFWRFRERKHKAGDDEATEEDADEDVDEDDEGDDSAQQLK